MRKKNNLKFIKKPPLGTKFEVPRNVSVATSMRDSPWCNVISQTSGRLCCQFHLQKHSACGASLGYEAEPDSFLGNHVGATLTKDVCPRQHVYAFF